MDVIAARLGIDPLALRQRNLLKRGEEYIAGDTPMDGDLTEGLDRAAHVMPASILTRTFIHVPGIGPTTETALWKSGVTSWRALLTSPARVAIGVRSRRDVESFLEESYKALGRGDARFFARHLPRQEWWRLYPRFRSKAVFLDIETTGLSHYYDEVTLVGLFDGDRVRTLLAGQNLDTIAALLEPYDLLITFNGTLFDVPFLKTKFPSLALPPIHLDLRYVMRRLGYAGGLKQIERQLGIRRRHDIGDVDGLMATVLWARYLRGDISALELLLKYNTADTTVLQSLMRYSCAQLAARLLPPSSASRPAIRARVTPPKRIHVSVTGTDAPGLSIHIGDYRLVLRREAPRRPSVVIRDLIDRMPSDSPFPAVVGIDLRASEARPTGWAVLRGDVAETKLLKSNEDLIRETLSCRPRLVSIDAPLTLPRGRCCTTDTCRCRRHGIVRECERILWRRGVRVYPCLLPSMQKLTQRGILLAEALRALGITVIESYPGAAQDIMRIPRKKTSLEDLWRGLAAFGIRGPFLSTAASHDELDAMTSAIVGYFYITGDVEELGSDDEGYLIIPRPALLPRGEEPLMVSTCR
jgi:uncharacterized protein YprB with RNaseH-like and TPR domain/predicted nuclease with RNAse H fold